MNSSDKKIEQRARALYIEATQRVDPATAGRLRAARRTALQATPASHHRAHILLPVGALTAVALAVLMIWQPTPRQAIDTTQPSNNPAAQSADQDTALPPGADKADPALYQNLDFYSWLAANDSSQTKH
jgi:hypothetical protein